MTARYVPCYEPPAKVRTPSPARKLYALARRVARIPSRLGWFCIAIIIVSAFLFVGEMG